MYESVVDTPANDHVIPLRKSYVGLLDGDKRAAFLLSILEYWTNHEKRENEISRRVNRDTDANREINDQLWIRRTRDHIADDSLGILPNEKAVSKAAKTLEEKGFIEMGHPDRDKGSNRKAYRLRIDRINAEMRSVSLAQQSRDEKREEEIREKVNDKADQDGWTEDDWQYQYAVRWWEKMEELGDKRIRSDWRERKAQIIQGWADAFDWCVRVRDLDREEVDQVLEWLFHENDFWIPNAAIIAPTKFKERNDQGQWRIHEFLTRSETEGSSGQDKNDIPDDGAEVRAFDRKRLISKYDEITEDNFTSIRYADGGDEMIYRFEQ